MVQELVVCRNDGIWFYVYYEFNKNIHEQENALSKLTNEPFSVVKSIFMHVSRL